MAVALITGADGFLGKYICRELVSRGDEVIPLARGPASKDNDSFTLSLKPTVLEVCRAADQAGADFIYHLAGISDASNLEALYQATVIYAQTVLSGAALARVTPKVVLIGSAAEYGKPVSSDMTTRESDVCNPLSAYGISKYTQTLHGMAASATGLNVTIARLFNPIGAGAPPSTALGSFVQQINAMTEAGGVLKTGPLNSVRDFIDVSEAARVIVEVSRLPGAQIKGQVFNVCTGSGYRLEQIVERLIADSGLHIDHQVENNRRGTSDLDTVIGSNEKLAKFGIEVAGVDLAKVIPEMLSRYKTN